ncbi:hypothetical protein BO71DRAFT_137800 [Aspergillus ellipticus CBS 707.79]|uniref:Uncharacterized protein n=1 Tax=Aspergillus ellipticus CBS 707.79 TaxID=1448320 RepID=A0A319DZY8_9EURO|nr:hypothetical protein BO71DRAFT_137800 [Aspergillus ellipticus CBS 707.79]
MDRHAECNMQCGIFYTIHVTSRKARSRLVSIATAPPSLPTSLRIPLATYCLSIYLQCVSHRPPSQGTPAAPPLPPSPQPPASTQVTNQVTNQPNSKPRQGPPLPAVVPVRCGVCCARSSLIRRITLEVQESRFVVWFGSAATLERKTKARVISVLSSAVTGWVGKWAMS